MSGPRMPDQQDSRKGEAQALAQNPGEWANGSGMCTSQYSPEQIAPMAYRPGAFRLQGRARRLVVNVHGT